MFDIKVGTLIPAGAAVRMIPQLNPKGFECYELNFTTSFLTNVDMNEFSKEILDVLDGKTISCLGIYDNTMMKEKVQNGVDKLIRSAHLFGCDRVGVFAGADETRSVPDQMGDFKKVFRPLADAAEGCGVKIGFENCGDGWDGGSFNIAFGPEAWELMFNEVDSDALGLEWEPCHQLIRLIDPIAQLRKWAPKVVHVHGKDATVAWDVIREHGIRGIHPFAWHRTPGFGDSNWADIFTILLQNGFEGACDIEGYHDLVHYDDMEWTAQLTSIDYLKRCRGGIEFFDGAEYKGYQGARKK